MKKYRIDPQRPLENPDMAMMKDTKLIVWIGSSEYWEKVFLNNKDHRLYIRTGFGRFELLDTFNIRKIEQA